MKNTNLWRSKVYATVFGLIIIFLSGCKTEEIKPINIFEEENLEELINSGEVVTLPLDDICGENKLFVNGARITNIGNGFKIKGTIFSESLVGNIAVTSGEFDLLRDEAGRINAFDGYGTAQFPGAGILNDAVEMADIFGSWTKYASGALFREEDGSLPFDDNQCYFRFTIDANNPLGQEEVGGPAMIKNTLFDYDQLYYDPTDPALFFDGKMHQFDVKDRPKPVEGGKDQPKKFKTQQAKTKYSVSDVKIGLSLNDKFVFRPLAFSDELETIVGGTNFEEFGAGFYMSGRVNLKKYPIIFEGESFIYSQVGLVDFFDLGFDQALYKRGVNGKVFFGHELLEILPFDLEIELGRATLQENIDINDLFLRFAGEFDMDTNDFFERVIGPEATKFIPSMSRNGKMYVNIGSDLSEWEYYMMQQFQLDIPGLTNTTLQKQYFHFTPNKIELGSEANLPFGLGGVELKGNLESDGSFLLYGTINADIPFGDGASLNGELTVEVSNEGAFLYGAVNLPGAVAGIEVKGQITEKGILLEGEGNVRISFGNSGSLATHLHVKASTFEGIFLDGSLETPLQVASVAVAGEISARGILLEGEINGMVDFGVTKLQSNLALSASTWGGAELSGLIDVPLVIIGGKVEAYGEILTENAFKLGASTEVTLGFEGFASISPMVSFAFSEREIDISAKAEFCLIECIDAGISFNPNWATGDVNICVKPFVVEICL